MASWAALLATMTAAASLASPPGASARSGYVTIPPKQWSKLIVKGSRGYRITIERSDGTVELTAGKQGASVSYGVRAERAAADEIKAKFPGVGRISLGFHPSGKARRWPSSCRGRAPIEQPGIFRGSIRFEGERGFTRVVSTQARGYIYRSFREICRRAQAHRGRTIRGYALGAVGRLHEKPVLFVAFKRQQESSVTSGAASYIASMSGNRRGMLIVRTVSAAASASTFTVEGPDTEPDAATVAPPPPFAGTASFHGTEGAPSEWQGTLTVEFPGAGVVPLTGPSFKSELCLNKRCVGQLGS